MSSDPITGAFNDGYITEAYEAYRRDPASVDESWRQFFRFAESLSGTAAPEAAAAGGEAPSAGRVDAQLLRKVAAAAKLVDAIRNFGHLAVPLDPLGTPPGGTPELTPEFHGLSEDDLKRIPGDALDMEGGTAADVVANLRDFYSSRIGFEIAHLGNVEEREWLREINRERASQRATERRREARGSSAPDRSRRARALSRTRVSGLQALLDRGERHRSSRCSMSPSRRPRRHGAREVDHRDGAPRPHQRSRAHARQAVRDDLRGVRGKARRHQCRERDRRREVPPRRAWHAEDASGGEV